MTAAGKTTSKQLRMDDVVLLEPAPWGDGAMVPAVRKGAGTIAARVLRVDTSPGGARAGRRSPTRYNVQLRTLDPTPVLTVINTSASQTWWLATASSHWRNTMTDQGILAPR